MTETLASPATEYGADALIVCDNLVRIYQVENIEVQALQGLDLLVDKGEMIAIVGQSGSGKSTLLNVLSGLDVPTAGAARVAGWDLLRMSHNDRLTYRRSVVGFVWQQTARNLLPYLTAKENVSLPLAFSGVRGGKRGKRAEELLDLMGMADKAGRKPSQLSGGEQQRVAIAVALANSPEVIFADEPTGELDSATGDEVFEALRAANRDLGATVVVVTHDHAVSSQVQRTVAIRDGRTATEVVRRTHVDEQGMEQTIHEEYAVLDRAGRMQLPKDYRDALALKDRVRLELEEDDHIGVWNDKTPHQPKAAAAAGAVAAAAAASADTPEDGAPARPTADPAAANPYAPREEAPYEPTPPPPPRGSVPPAERPTVRFEDTAPSPSAPSPSAAASSTSAASAPSPSAPWAAAMDDEDSTPYQPRVPASPPSPTSAEHATAQQPAAEPSISPYLPGMRAPAAAPAAEPEQRDDTNRAYSPYGAPRPAEPGEESPSSGDEGKSADKRQRRMPWLPNEEDDDA